MKWPITDWNGQFKGKFRCNKIFHAQQGQRTWNLHCPHYTKWSNRGLACELDDDQTNKKRKLWPHYVIAVLSNLLLKIKGNYPAVEHSAKQYLIFLFCRCYKISKQKTITLRPTCPSLLLTFSHLFCLRLYYLITHFKVLPVPHLFMQLDTLKNLLILQKQYDLFGSKLTTLIQNLVIKK